MIIYSFTLTLILLIIVQSRQSTEVCCWLYQYVFYIFLYTAIPYIYVFYPNEIVNIDLPNLDAVNVKGLAGFSTISNITLLFSLLFMGNKKRKIVLRPPEIKIMSNLPILLFYCLIPISIAMSTLFPWGNFGDVKTIGHSLASYLKLMVSFIFILQSALQRQSKKPSRVYKLSFLLMVILFAVDTARTTFFVTLISVSYAYRFTFRSVYKYLIPISIIFLLFMYVTLSRTGIDFRFEFLLWPFFSEGIFGSYSALNALSINSYVGFNISSAFLYFPDQVMAILPSKVMDLFNYEFNFLKVLSDANAVGLVNGKLSPLGGFFAFADMILAFSWLGAVIFPILIFIYIYASGKSGFVGLYLYITFFLFLKSPLYVVFNMVVAGFLIVMGYKILLMLLPKKCVRDIDGK